MNTEPDHGLDVLAIDQEVSHDTGSADVEAAENTVQAALPPTDNTAPPAEAAQPDEPNNGASWDALVSAVGEIPEDDNILDQLTPKQIAKLPPEARGIVRMAIGRANKEYSRRAEAQEKKLADLNAQEERIKNDSRKLLEERARMGELLNSGELKKYLQQADQINPEKLDLQTRAGREAFLKREAAEGIRKLAEPITKAATRAQREQDYREFREKNVRMNEQGFRSKVISMLKEMEAKKTPILLQDAYNRVLLTEQTELREARRDHRKKLRAESMTKVSKRTVSSTQAPEPFTTEKRKSLRKQGYTSKSGQKYFGETAVAMYFREHPEALKTVRATQKNRMRR